MRNDSGLKVRSSRVEAGSELLCFFDRRVGSIAVTVCLKIEGEINGASTSKSSPTKLCALAHRVGHHSV